MLIIIEWFIVYNDADKWSFLLVYELNRCEISSWSQSLQNQASIESIEKKMIFDSTLFWPPSLSFPIPTHTRVRSNYDVPQNNLKKTHRYDFFHGKNDESENDHADCSIGDGS